MFKMNDWEIFYTESKNDEDHVDQVSIDVRNGRYILDIDADYYVLDGYDEEGEEIYSCYVSRFVFDIIVEGLKQNDFSEYREV